MHRFRFHGISTVRSMSCVVLYTLSPVQECHFISGRGPPLESILVEAPIDFFLVIDVRCRFITGFTDYQSDEKVLRANESALMSLSNLRWRTTHSCSFLTSQALTMFSYSAMALSSQVVSGHVVSIH